MFIYMMPAACSLSTTCLGGTGTKKVRLGRNVALPNIWLTADRTHKQDGFGVNDEIDEFVQVSMGIIKVGLSRATTDLGDDQNREE